MKYRIIASVQNNIFYNLRKYIIGENFVIASQGWADNFPIRFIDVDCTPEEACLIGLKFNVTITQVSDKVFGTSADRMWFDELNTDGMPKLHQSIGRGIRQSKTIPTIIDYISRVSS